MEADRERHIISRRKFLAAVAASASSLALVACGGGTGTTPSAATTASAESIDAGAEATAAPVAEEAPAEEVPAEPAPEPTVGIAELGTGSQKLVYWHGLGGADGATQVTMLQQYASENPDISISSETYDWGVFYQKLPTATAAGTPPHMGMMHSWGIPQFANQGILQEADTLFYQPGLIPKEDFPPALIEAVTVEGKTQSVPFDNHGWLNWVNTKVITDAGLDPAALPKNGAEFITWAQQITVDEAGKHPNEDGFDPDRVKVWATHSAWQKFTLGSTIRQFGGDIFSEDKKTSLLNDPKTIAAVQYWHDLIYKYYVAPPAVPGVSGPGDLFKTNSIALMWDGTWNLNFFKDNPDAEAVMDPMWLNSLGPDGKQAVRYDSHMMVVPTGVEDPGLGLAKGLIQWLSDNGETWATSGQVPARLSVQGKPAVTAIESVKVAGEQFAAIGVPGESHTSINEIVTAYEAAFSAILANTTPTEEAMNEAHTAVQSILDRG